MYYNELMPDCVPEYYRSRFEAEDHEYEKHLTDQERYRANRGKLAAAEVAGLPVLDFCGYGYCGSGSCETADHDTQTGPNDDLCRVICHGPGYPWLSKARGEPAKNISDWRLDQREPIC